MIYNLRVIGSTLKLQMKQSFARPTYKYCLLVQPIIYSVITYMMFKNSNQNNFVSFVVLGTGLLSLWSCICFSSAGDIERERFMGTLQVNYCTPTNFKIIMFGKILGNTILGLLPFAVSFSAVKTFFHDDIYVNGLNAFSISMLATILSFIGISMILAAFFTLSRSSIILMNCIEYPIFILCGILFPIEMLPQWTTPLSYILSPTWAARILGMSIEGITDNVMFSNYLKVLIMLTIAYFFISYILFNIVDKRIRISGDLGVN